MTGRPECDALDRADPLAHVRDRFELPGGAVYLDGNSLGPLSRSARERLAAVAGEWGERLIAGWFEAGWLQAPERVGDRIGTLLGAAPGQVIVSDQTSVNLYKLLLAGLRLRPDRGTVLVEHAGFPTDRYLLQGLAEAGGSEIGAGGRRVRRVEGRAAAAAVDRDTAVVLLTHVDYRSGRMLDLAQVTAAAHEMGALVLWDLSHSAGAVPIDLDGCAADLAAGCTYKFLNGGPGAPAFLYVARRLQEQARTPIQGWFGHADPFAFAEDYEPAPGIRRFLAGSPGILGLAALEGALDAWEGVEMSAVRAKSTALGELLIRLVDERCAGLRLEVASPRDPAVRGSQVSLRHPDAGALVRRLAGRGVVTDFRPPDLVRCGLTPLYLRYTDVWDAVEVLRELLVG